MNKYLLFLFIGVYLYSDITIKPFYCVDTSNIYKSFFTKKKSDTKLLVKLPKNFKSFSVPTIKISRELNSFKDTSGGIIKFKRCVKSNNNLKFIKIKLLEEIKRKIPNIKIISLDIKAMSKKDVFNISRIKIRDIRNRGVFKVVSLGGVQTTFRYELKAKVSAFITKKQMSRKTKIDANDIKKEFVKLSSKSFVTNRSEIVGKVTKTRIPKARAILKHMIEKEKVLKKGDEVIAIYRDGFVEINLEVTALKSGAVGEEIPVKSTTGKILKAIVKTSRFVSIL